MSQPFIGEIRMFGGNFAPAGWTFCDGSCLPISENETLFNLIGTTYGGDGQETFCLPDLRSRVPIHAGTGQDGITYQLGESGGVESITLTVNQIPTHTHIVEASNTTAAAQTPGGNVFAQGAGQIYTSAISAIPLTPQTVSSDGGSQPHENLQPYLCISFIISLFGIFPQQN